MPSNSVNIKDNSHIEKMNFILVAFQLMGIVFKRGLEQSFVGSSIKIFAK